MLFRSCLKLIRYICLCFHHLFSFLIYGFKAVSYTHLDVYKRQRFNQPDEVVQQLEFDGLHIDIENRSITTGNGTFELPPKEFDLLLYCAENQGRILTKRQIYEKVWDEEYFYDDSNIMAIISRLRKKLKANPSSPKYIQTIKGIGYRFNKEV